MAFLLPLLPLLQLQYTLDTLPQTFSNAPRTLPTLTQKSNWMACGRNDVHHWNLPNGNVRFDTPLHIYLEERGVKSSVSLSDPMFLGSGGSGAVFSFNIDRSEQSIDIDDQVAVKVSWKASRSTVENECNILQTLESNHVPHTERCLAQMPYDEHRTMIALKPVVTQRTSSITSISQTAQDNAIHQVVETTLSMLLANVITVDVQPLISDTGEVLFIDFTEAGRVSVPPTPRDLSGVVGFCNEMIALIPEDRRDYAMQYFELYLKDLEKHGFVLQEQVRSIVVSIFFKDDM